MARASDALHRTASAEIAYQAQGRSRPGGDGLQTAQKAVVRRPCRC